LPWELGKTRNIATEADFIAHFNTYFTADMRKTVAGPKARFYFPEIST